MSLSSKKCCVPTCMDSGGMQKPLHLFPNPEKDKQRFNIWVHSVGGDIIGLDNEDIYKHRRVCHAHFDEKFCCRYKKLSDIAIPTLSLPGPTSLPKFTFDERRPQRQIQHDMSRNSASSSKDCDTDANAITAATNAAGKENIGPCLLPRLTYGNKTKLYQMQQNQSKLSTVHLDAADTYTQDTASTVASKKEDIGPTSLPKLKFDERRPLRQIQHDMSQNLPSSSINHGTVANVITTTTNAASKENIRSIKKKTRAVFSKAQLVTALERRLYSTLIKVKNKLSKNRSKTKKQRQSLVEAKKLATNTEFKEMINKLPKMAKILTMMQYREIKKKEKGRRFSVEEKIIALSIFKQSPKCYRFLRKIFILPAAQTLTKLINKANVKPGINRKLFVQLKKATETMKVEDKLCIVLFDEMALKANIAYNERKDEVTGFVTDGQSTKPEYADHAQVFMIRGLIKNYKQPISYTFSAGATSGPELAKQLKQVIKQLQEAGFIVLATICDQGSNNRSAIKLLLQETRGLYLRTGREPKKNVFLINEQEIVHIYDPPHLLKCLRNNLLTKNLEYVRDNKTHTAKWQHLELLLKENPGYRGIRLMPKLTDNHIIPSKIPKMKVKYATQVFSQTVASNMGYLADKGILPQQCKETADVLLLFDKLFDSVNGSYSKKGKHGKPLLGPVRPNSLHHQVWNELKNHLKKMKFIKPTTGKREHVPTIENWVWTLDSIQILLKKLNDEYSITSVWMRHLNQDPIENFFGAIRSHGCRNINPTTERFETAYTSLLINNMSSAHAPGANCESDYCKVLHNLIVEDDCQAPETTFDLDLQGILDVQMTDSSEKNDPRVMGALQFVSGYLVRCAKRKVFKNCIECIANLVASHENEYIRVREYAGRRWLVSPSESLVSCISGMQDIINDILKKNVFCKNIKELIKTIVLSFVSFDFLSCEQHKNVLISYIINLTCRFFIYNYCKDINKILIGKRDSNDDEDNFQIKAKKYFRKCMKRHQK